MVAAWIALGFALGYGLSSLVNWLFRKPRLPEVMTFDGHKYLAVPNGTFMISLGYTTERR